jgi:hypothetical protein
MRNFLGGAVKEKMYDAEVLRTLEFTDQQAPAATQNDIAWRP